MDPTETLRELLDALSDLEAGRGSDARDDAIERLEALTDWLKQGGFAPRVSEVLV